MLFCGAALGALSTASTQAAEGDEPPTGEADVSELVVTTGDVTANDQAFVNVAGRPRQQLTPPPRRWRSFRCAA